jgi:ABC-type nitrate/sulfonate/bicarbonate transport system substrate-binding protein
MISKTSKIRRIEDLKGAIIGVSQYGSEADIFARLALAKAELKEAAYLYQDQVPILEALPAPNEKAIQALLDRENDPKIKSTPVTEVIDASFFRDIEKSGLIEQLYKGKNRG